MKIYIAGSFSRKPEMRRYANDLASLGHVCTSRWILQDGHEADVTTQEELAWDGPAYRYATEDINDIEAAHAMFFFSSAAAGLSKGRGGRHTEFGIALMIRMPIFFIGLRECAFHALVPPQRAYDDWAGVLNSIEAIEWDVKNNAIPGRS